MKKLQTVLTIAALVTVACWFTGCQKQEKAAPSADAVKSTEAAKTDAQPATPAAASDTKTEAAPAPAPAKE